MHRFWGWLILVAFVAAGCSMLVSAPVDYLQDRAARMAEDAAEVDYESPMYCPTCGDAEVNDKLEAAE